MVARVTRGLAAGMLAVGLALPLAAETPEASIVRQLRAQGYSSVTVTRTLLGRLRFVATAGTVRREIIFNPRTGEILRDYSEKSGNGLSGPTIWANKPASSPGTSKGGSDDDGEAGDDGDEGDDGDAGDDGEGDDGEGDSSGESGDDGEGDSSGSSGGDDGEGDSSGSGSGESDGEGDGEGDGESD